MPSEGRHRAEHGDSAAKKIRDALQRNAAGLSDSGKGGSRGDSGKPMPVTLAGGQGDFFDKLSKALGISTSGNGPKGLGDMTKQFQAMITEQKAITQASKQMVQEMKGAAQAMRMMSSSQSGSTKARRHGGAQPPGYDNPTTMDIPDLDNPGGRYQINLPASSTPPPRPDGPPSPGQFRGIHADYHATQFGAGNRQQALGPTSLGDLRKRTHGGIGNAIHQQFGMGDQQKPTPVRQYDKQTGELLGYQNYHQGQQVGELAQPGTDEFKAAAGAEKSMSRASNIGESLAGGGVKAGLRAVPYLGEALMAGEGVKQAASFVANQREANRPYQNIYGGSSFGGAGSDLGNLFSGGNANVTSGLGGRMAEEGFSLKNLLSGTMSSDNSQQAFQGVSALGQNGQQRGDSLQFITDQYTKLGVSVQDSLKLVQTAAQYTGGSLSGVAQGLDSVTKSAQATGQSAASLQQQFSTAFQQAAVQGFGGASAGVAQGSVNAMGGTNRGLSGMNVASGVMSSLPMQYLAASSVGMSPGQLEASTAQGNPGLALKATGNAAKQMLAPLMTPAIQAAFQKSVQGEGGASYVQSRTGSQENVANDVMAAGLDPNIAAQLLQQAGQDTTGKSPQQIVEAALNIVGYDTTGQQANQLNKQNAPKPLTGVDKQSVSGVQTNATAMLGGQSSFVSKYKQGLPKPNNALTAAWDSVFGGNPGETGKASASAYSDYQKKSKTSDPAMEKAITQMGNNPDVGIRVQTGDGPKVVSLADAIKNYPDQVQDGKAEVVGGSNDGQTLGAATGVSDTGVTPGKNGVTDSSKKKGGPGQSEKDFRSDHNLPDKPGAQPGATGGGGVITVQLSPQVAQYFNFSASGGNVKVANGQGTVPDPSGGH